MAAHVVFIVLRYMNSKEYKVLWFPLIVFLHSMPTLGLKSALSQTSVAAVKASVIQGSGLGPASFIVIAADLHPITPGNHNRIFKFADDTYMYLVVPVINSSSRLDEVSRVEAWASRNNLRLNRTISKKLIFIREKCGQSQPPPPCPNIEPLNVSAAPRS